LKFFACKLIVISDKDYSAVINIPCYMELEDSFCCVASCLLFIPYVMLQLKVKQSRYRPAVTQRVPGS